MIFKVGKSYVTKGGFKCRIDGEWGAYLMVNYPKNLKRTIMAQQCAVLRVLTNILYVLEQKK